MEKEWYIIRHAQTDLNKQGIVQGKGVNADINAHGRDQAQAFYKTYKDVPFDKIYISSLKRTYQTVEPFIRQGIPYERLPGLDEIGWGIYEGKAQDDAAKAEFQSVIARWEQGELDVCVQEGETPMEVQLRLQTAMEHILNDSESHTTLVCMHGRVLRMFLCILTGCPLSEMNKFPHNNTALYRLAYRDGNFELLETYNTAHLEGLKST